MKSIVLAYIISMLLGLLFFYAAISKLVEYAEFQKQLNYSPYIASFSSLLSWSLPAVELLIAALLIIKATRLWGLYASLALMTAFTAYLVMMLNFAKIEEVPCPCGGILGEMSWTVHVWFNLIFVALAGLGIWLQRKKLAATKRQISVV